MSLYKQDYREIKDYHKNLVIQILLVMLEKLEKNEHDPFFLKVLRVMCTCYGEGNTTNQDLLHRIMSEKLHYDAILMSLSVQNKSMRVTPF